VTNKHLLNFHETSPAFIILLQVVTAGVKMGLPNKSKNQELVCKNAEHVIPAFRRNDQITHPMLRQIMGHNHFICFGCLESLMAKVES